MTKSKEFNVRLMWNEKYKRFEYNPDVFFMHRLSKGKTVDTWVDASQTDKKILCRQLNGEI
jgi:hypothetical protein